MCIRDRNKFYFYRRTNIRLARWLPPPATETTEVSSALHKTECVSPYCRSNLLIVATHGSDIVFSTDETTVRVAYPYADDLSYAGVLIQENGTHSGIEIKSCFIFTPMNGITGTFRYSSQHVEITEQHCKDDKICEGIHITDAAGTRSFDWHDRNFFSLGKTRRLQRTRDLFLYCQAL